MESSLRAWLALQCRLIPGAEAALAVLGASERAAGAAVAAWPTREQVPARLAATVAAARESGRPAAQESAAPDAPLAVIDVALPLSRDGRSVGAVGVRVRRDGAAEAKAVAELLGVGIRGLELVVEARREQARLADRLALAGSLLDHDRLPEAAHALTTELAQRFGCERVALGLLRRGRLRVVALSSSVRFAPESDALRDLRSAMEEAADQDAVIELPARKDAPPHVTRAHARLLPGEGGGAVCSIPLAARDRPVGVLTCEWGGGAAARGSGGVVSGRETSTRVAEAVLLCGPLLALAARADAGPVERCRAGLAAWSERHFGARPGLAKAVLAGIAALALLLAAVPVPYRVSARATLEGRVQRVLVAPVDGYLAEARARAGDLVSAGDVLARLDDRDLRLEHRKWQSQKAQLEGEYREALAAQDRTRVSILRARIDKAVAELELAQEELGRTSVVAPFDGVVVEGDLRQALGSPVERGRVLFEVAPLDGYRIILQVDGRDIADVAPGQRGRLALAALPGEPLPLVVERITPIATSEDGRSYFRAEARLSEPAASLRPGMEGVARVEVGERRRLWVWTHGLLDWLRLRAWSFLP